MLLVSGILVGVVLLLVVLKSLASSSSEMKSSEGTSVIRGGKSVAADQVFDAWTSNDMGKMLKALENQTNPVDRHFLLLSIVEKAYRGRTDPRSRLLCLEIARRHMAEFPALAPALKRDMGDGTLPQVHSFKYLSTLLSEDGQYDEAIRVCEWALGYGLDDGTAGGFSARIERMKKKQLAGKKASGDRHNQ
jgi:hypothetical protein